MSMKYASLLVSVLLCAVVEAHGERCAGVTRTTVEHVDSTPACALVAGADVWSTVDGCVCSVDVLERDDAGCALTLRRKCRLEAAPTPPTDSLSHQVLRLKKEVAQMEAYMRSLNIRRPAVSTYGKAPLAYGRPNTGGGAYGNRPAQRPLDVQRGYGAPQATAGRAAYGSGNRGGTQQLSDECARILGLVSGVDAVLGGNATRGEVGVTAHHDEADDSVTPTGVNGAALSAELGYIDKGALRRDSTTLTVAQQTTLMTRADNDLFWHLYKKTFKKDYGGNATLEAIRYETWSENVAAMKLHNALHSGGARSTRAGINHFTDRSPFDWVERHFNGIRYRNIYAAWENPWKFWLLTDDKGERERPIFTDFEPVGNATTAVKENRAKLIREKAAQAAASNSVFAHLRTQRQRRRQSSASTTLLPKEVDWRTKGVVSRVKNQGECGSCWAFTSTGAIESLNAIEFTQPVVELSEQQFIDCGDDYEADGCDGGFITMGFAQAISNGQATEQTYPYLATQQDACPPPAATVFISEFREPASGDEDALALQVARQPVATAIHMLDTLKCYLNHSVLIVGYGESEADGKYWIVKNSWSEHWGEGGYIRVRRGVNMCGIATKPSYPVI